MKIYLVSEIYSYTDDRMTKEFQIFYDKESAIEYKEAVKEAIISDLMEYAEVEDEDELFQFYEITNDYDTLWGYLSPDCTTEFELEVTELDLLQWNQKGDVI